MTNSVTQPNTDFKQEALQSPRDPYDTLHYGVHKIISENVCNRWITFKDK